MKVGTVQKASVRHNDRQASVEISKPPQARRFHKAMLT
jgi:hypothetical protein